MKRHEVDVSRGNTITRLFIAAVLAGGACLTGCSKAGEHGRSPRAEPTVYTCAMHPEVIQDHPGLCSICGMRLTPVRRQNGAENADMRMAPARGADMAAGRPGTVAIDSVTIQNMGLRTAVVTRGPLRRTVHAIGAIGYSQATMAEVTARFEGWIEKLYVNTLGQRVTRGDPLFEIYSPELYGAQADYLLAVGAGEGQALPARSRLKAFDVPDERIAELERTRQPQRTLLVLAPRDGVVIEQRVVEGQMAERGAVICRLADTGVVWVRADIPEQDLAYVQRGQEATLAIFYLRDREFRGRVTYVPPDIDERTHAACVRLEFENPGSFLKPGMAATVSLVSELEPSALLIPEMAILRGGKTTTVFVALDGGRFDPRTVTLGPRTDAGEYQVLSGVSEGERIVTSGQFMLDSESQLQEAIRKMVQPRQGPARGERPMPGMSSAGGGTNAIPSGAPEAPKYICPVPEHVPIQYDQPGACPICGAALVRVSEAALKKVQPGGEVIYYTCPLPEHGDARSETPGRCPKCGATLIPVMEAPPITDSGGDMAHPGHNH
jgi:multidrug efflux pump subunit AcrA (membrane-fusion protein)